MRRLTFVVLLAAGCGRSTADELKDRLAELDRVSREAEAVLREYDPFEARMREAHRRGDQAEAERIREEAQPIGRRYKPLDQKLRDLHKKIADLAASALVKNPDDAAALEARVRLNADYPLTSQKQDRDDSLDELLADSEKLLRLRPNDRDAAARRASGLRRAGRLTEARDLLAAGARTTRTAAEEGLVALALDDYAAAVRALEDASKKPDDIPAATAHEVDLALKSARERLPLWDKEQELRKRDAAANVPQVKLVTSRGEIVVELFEDDAPNTVANFVHLVETRFYDGTKFHRVIPNFMAQGGDPNSKNDNPKDDGQGGPGWSIKDELEEGRFRRHFRGSLSMANSGPNTNGSQFFLTHRATEHLDGRHTVFGRVLSGQDVVDKLAAGDVLQEAVVLRRRDHPYRPIAEK